jgi:hypothetical protein
MDYMGPLFYRFLTGAGKISIVKNQLLLLNMFIPYEIIVLHFWYLPFEYSVQFHQHGFSQAFKHVQCKPLQSGWLPNL